MSKTFKENYYDEDSWCKKKQGKSSKQKRQRVKDYLRQIERDGFIEEDEDEFEDLSNE